MVGASRGSLLLGPAEKKLLAAGARGLGATVGASEIARLAEFAAELDTWNKRFNLISCATGRELVCRHLLDSIAAVRFTVDARESADLGSGAGLPGIPLAVVTGGTWVLVEARRRRANFLRSVVRRLHLARVTVLEQRVEELGWLSGPWDLVTSRGVWGVPRLLEIAGGLLRPGGVAIAFVGRKAGLGASEKRFEQIGAFRWEGGLRGVEAYRLRAP